MLTLQLRTLKKDDLVKRTVYAEVPPKVEYELTAAISILVPATIPFPAIIQDWFRYYFFNVHIAKVYVFGLKQIMTDFILLIIGK